MNDRVHAIDAVDEEAAGWCIRMAEGSLNAEDYYDFLAWLDRDPNNGSRFDRAAAVWGVVETQAEQPDMLRLREETLSEFRQVQARRWSLRRRWTRIHLPARTGWVSAVAACLVAMVTISIVYVAQLQTRYQTGISERRVVMLEDGSRLSLDADSEVLVHYARDRRDLTLVRGRANFSVARNPTRPFTVTAGDDRITAIGTQFSVEQLRSQTQVILYEGHVRVTQRDGAIARSRMGRDGVVAPAEQQLQPGRRLILPADGATIGRVDAVPGTDPRASATLPAWEAGQIEFDDEPLTIAAERMNRYAPANRKLAVAPNAAALRISGVFNADEPAIFASEVTAIFNLKRVNADGVTTLSRR